MNLHSIAVGQIRGINPCIRGQLRVCIGYVTGASGKQVPDYDPIRNITIQVQPLSTSDIQKIEGLNLQGKSRKMFLSGQIDGLVRVDSKGGDLITIPEGTWKGSWLVNQILEQWKEWVSVVVTLQNEEIS